MGRQPGGGISIRPDVRGNRRLYTGVPMQLNEAAKRMDAEDGYGDAEIYTALEKMYAGYDAEPSQVGRPCITMSGTRAPRR